MFVFGCHGDKTSLEDILRDCLKTLFELLVISFVCFEQF